MKRGGSKRKAATRAGASIPEVDFSRAIQPHRYAKLRSGYRYTVMLEQDLWERFGSADAVKAALRGLVSASRFVRAAG
jgi:hypothetical protein